MPKDIALTPPQLARFEVEYGHRDYARQWRIPVRSVSLPFVATQSDFTPWLGRVSERVWVDSWGIGHERARDGSHFEHLIHPLAHAQTVEQINAYPFPRAAAEAEIQIAARQVSQIKDQDRAVNISVSPVGGTIFWPAYKLRGMENLLCDMIADEELTAALIDRVSCLCVEQAERAASLQPDIIHLADDLGTQLSTYMSRDLFLRWIKPGITAVIRAAKRVCPEVLISFHSDGAMQAFIPDLIEAGVDILNPIQPECMDPYAIHKTYGDRLSLYGCIGTQTTLPFASAREVGSVTRRICADLGRQGGLWIAPTHVVEPEVPWENVLAFIEAASEFE